MPLKILANTLSTLPAESSDFKGHRLHMVRARAAAGGDDLRPLLNPILYVLPELLGSGTVFLPPVHHLRRTGIGFGNQRLLAMSPHEAHDLRHLVEVLRDSRAEYIKIEFARRGGETLVFPREAMLAATEEILTDNGIRSAGSPDTLAVWNAKPSR